MLATYMRCMHNNRLEIRNAGSSYRQQLITFLGMDEVVHGALILFTQVIRMEILCINKIIKLNVVRERLNTKYTVPKLCLDRLLHRLESQPIFSETFEIEWCKPFDFQRKFPIFPCKNLMVHVSTCSPTVHSKFVIIIIINIVVALLYSLACFFSLSST